MKFALLILFSCSIFSYSQDLSWDKTAFVYNAALGDKGVEVVFSVSNKTNKDIVIPKAKSSCACMSLKTSFPLLVKSGGDAKVKLYYDFTGKIGVNRGTLYVHGPGDKLEFSIVVDIPVPVLVKPSFLIWKKNSRDKKLVTINFHKDYKGSIESAACVDANSDIKVLMTKEKGGAVVSIAPPSGKVAKKRTWVIVKGKDAEGKSQEYRIYLIFN